MTARLLIVEDQGQLAVGVKNELHRIWGYDCRIVSNPNKIEPTLNKGAYDVALVDLLYKDLRDEFDERRMAGAVSLTGRQLLVTGLTAIKLLRAKAPHTKIVLWTTGEGSRALHLVYAYEKLGVNVLVSKDTQTGTLDVLHRGIQAALRDEEYVDQALEAYLPQRGSPTAEKTFFPNSSIGAIWKSCALGTMSNEEIATKVGISTQTVSRYLGQMYSDLLAFNPGRARRHSKPATEVQRYAESNWEFFLDDALREM